MTQEKLDRINELAHLAKERELTADEQEERAALRKEYIEDWRRGTIELLENTYIVTPDGKKHKLPYPYRRRLCGSPSACRTRDRYPQTLRTALSTRLRRAGH